MPSSKRHRSDAGSCRRRIYSAAALAFSSAFLFGLATNFEWIAPDSWPAFTHKPKPEYGAPLDLTSHEGYQSCAERKPQISPTSTRPSTRTRSRRGSWASVSRARYSAACMLTTAARRRPETAGAARRRPARNEQVLPVSPFPASFRVICASFIPPVGHVPQSLCNTGHVIGTWVDLPLPARGLPVRISNGRR